MSASHGEHDHDDHHEPGFWRKYVFSEDHKMIGLQFLFSGLLFLGLGGLLALGVRWQLGWPWTKVPLIGEFLFPETGGVMSPEFYTMLFSMHATVMIFFVIIPLLTGAFGNFLIPLMIGARDMAFPKLNMFSYWFMWPAFLTMCASFFVEGGAAAAGWTSYPPLSVQASAAPGSGLGQTLWLVSVTFVGLSSMSGSVNYVTTIVMMRCPGMTLMRMPLTVWALFITAILQAFALPVLTAAGFMQLLDRTIGSVFFTPAIDGYMINGVEVTVGGGKPLLWQHLFWFYSHPAVYIMILPAMGIVSDVISTFARKPIFGYKPMILAISGIAGLGFIVWGHHMFQSGMNPAVGMTMMVTTMFIALPSAVKVFNWLGTIWGGRIIYSSAMLCALGFVSLFLIGGLSGIFMASTPVDIYIHDTYFIVAHIHYVLFGGSLFGIFAGIYYWFPKMFGRHLDETWGKVHFFISFVAMNCTFFPMHILGVGGMPRRLADPFIYEYLEPLRGLNTFVSISAMVMGLAQIILVANVIASLAFGKKCGQNPWNANTLDWVAAAPAPGIHGNFGPELPVVHGGPYEYARPEAEHDWTAQTDPR
jgi:cytochrome c oxidase subunit I